jgi:ribose 5-phosphate isomerase B
MKIVVASDEKTPLTDFVIDYLKSKGHEISLLGDLVKKQGKWAEISMEAAQKVVNGEADMGIVFCWSGTGVTMAANKVKGARAALCSTPQIAQLARKWNDANILTMAIVHTSPETAKEILDTWFATEFDEEGLDQAHMLDKIG